MHRWIDLDGVVNMRDLGGLPTRDGGFVQERRLIRSDNLQDLSPADVQHLVDDVGVSDIVDLRSHRELHLTGHGPLRATPLRHHHHSFFPDPGPDDPPPAAPQVRAERPPVDADYWSRHYRGYLTRRPDSVAAALSVVATAPGATIVHCAAGKDRTGTVIGVALLVAGVPREEIIADYVLSTERLEQIVGRLVAHEAYKDLFADRPITDQEPLAESMAQLLDMVEDDFGGAPAWLREQGWTADEVAALHARLVLP